jgi:hypothetical protein
MALEHDLLDALIELRPDAEHLELVEIDRDNGAVYYAVGGERGVRRRNYRLDDLGEVELLGHEDTLRVRANGGPKGMHKIEAYLQPPPRKAALRTSAPTVNAEPASLRVYDVLAELNKTDPEVAGILFRALVRATEGGEPPPPRAAAAAPASLAEYDAMVGYMPLSRTKWDREPAQASYAHPLPRVLAPGQHRPLETLDPASYAPLPPDPYIDRPETQP